MHRELLPLRSAVIIINLSFIGMSWPCWVLNYVTVCCKSIERLCNSIVFIKWNLAGIKKWPLFFFFFRLFCLFVSFFCLFVLFYSLIFYFYLFWFIYLPSYVFLPFLRASSGTQRACSSHRSSLVSCGFPGRDHI